MAAAASVYAGEVTNAPTSRCPSPPNGANPPFGTAMALGAPTEVRWGGHDWYNFSVQSAGGGVLLEDLNFQVLASSGTLVPPGGFSLTILGLHGTSLATFSMTTGNWTSGGPTPLSSQQSVSLEAPFSLSGDSLLVTMAGNACGSGGSITVAIP